MPNVEKQTIQEVLNRNLNLNGSIALVSQYISGLSHDYPNHCNFRIKCDRYDHFPDLWGDRLETDQEQQKRIDQESLKEQQAANKQNKQIAKAKALLAKAGFIVVEQEKYDPSERYNYAENT